LVPFIARLGAGFVPNRVLLFGTDGAGVARLATAVPIVEGKGARGPDAVAYVCEGRTCDLPTSDADIFVRQLARVTPLP